jgi:hypothetical protein
MGASRIACKMSSGAGGGLEGAIEAHFIPPTIDPHYWRLPSRCPDHLVVACVQGGSILADSGNASETKGLVTGSGGAVLDLVSGQLKLPLCCARTDLRRPLDGTQDAG